MPSTSRSTAPGWGGCWNGKLGCFTAPNQVGAPCVVGGPTGCTGPLWCDLRTNSCAPYGGDGEACGPDVELMIDAGRVWTWKQALQMSRRFEEFELSWLEEPLPVDDLDGYARLCEHSSLRIAS